MSDMRALAQHITCVHVAEQVPKVQSRREYVQVVSPRPARQTSMNQTDKDSKICCVGVRDPQNIITTFMLRLMLG